MAFSPRGPRDFRLLVHEARRRDGVGGRAQRVPLAEFARTDRHEGSPVQIIASHPFPCSVAVADRRVGSERKDVAVREMAAKAQRDARRDGQETREPRHEPLGRKRRHAGDRQQVAIFARAQQFDRRVADLAQRAGDACVVHLPGTREHEAAPLAHEQLHTEQRLEIRDLPADRAGRQAQFAGRVGEVQILRRTGECVQFRDVRIQVLHRDYSFGAQIDAGFVRFFMTMPCRIRTLRPSRKRVAARPAGVARCLRLLSASVFMPASTAPALPMVFRFRVTGRYARVPDACCTRSSRCSGSTCCCRSRCC